MLNAILTIISILCALIFFIMGMMLIIAGKDNFTKYVIGVITIIMSSMVFASLSTLLPHIIDYSIESIPKMIIPVKTELILLLLVVLLALFPILALNPDWSRRKIFSIIFIPVGAVIALYLPFAFGLIPETELYSELTLSANLKIIFDNLYHPDVIFRFLLLLLIFIVPVAIYTTSSLIHISHKNRKPTVNYKIYQVALFFLSIVIFSYCLYLKYSTIAIVIFLPSFVSILLVGYYRNASYLTTFINPITEEDTSEQPDNRKVSLSSVDASFLDIWNKMDEMVNANDRFTNPNLQMQTIADEMRISKILLTDTLHRKGFNSFKEYINDLRLKRFKELAEKNPGSDITDLYEMAGFSSKSTFYRFFSIAEGITPSDYMKKLCRFNNM